MREQRSHFTRFSFYKNEGSLYFYETGDRIRNVNGRSEERMR